MLVYNRISPSSSVREKQIPVLITELVSFTCTGRLTPSIPVKDDRVQVDVARTLDAGCISPSSVLGALGMCTQGSTWHVAGERPQDSQKREGAEWAAVARKL